MVLLLGGSGLSYFALADRSSEGGECRFNFQCRSPLVCENPGIGWEGICIRTCETESDCLPGETCFVVKFDGRWNSCMPQWSPDAGSR